MSGGWIKSTKQAGIAQRVEANIERRGRDALDIARVPAAKPI